MRVHYGPNGESSEGWNFGQDDSAQAALIGASGLAPENQLGADLEEVLTLAGLSLGLTKIHEKAAVPLSYPAGRRQ